MARCLTPFLFLRALLLMELARVGPLPTFALADKGQRYGFVRERVWDEIHAMHKVGLLDQVVVSRCLNGIDWHASDLAFQCLLYQFGSMSTWPAVPPRLVTPIRGPIPLRSGDQMPVTQRVMQTWVQRVAA